jgi:tetratricopeptide (TPR) repeat protein
VRGRLGRGLSGAALALALLLAPAAAVRAQQYGGAPAGGGEAKTETKKAEPEKQKRWGKKKKEKWGKTDTVGERTGKRLSKALELLQAEKFDEAAAELAQLRVKSLNPFERAQVYRVQAFVVYGKGNTPGALDLLSKALAENALTPEDQSNVRFQIAQLYLSEQKWPEVVKNLNEWFKTAENPNSSAYYLLAVAYYQMEDVDKALEPAQKAVELSDEPSEAWMQLLLAIRLTRKEYEEAIPVLEKLITRYPKRLYWVQLSTVFGALSKFEQAVIPLQLAWSQGELTEPAELRRLAQLLLYLDLPLPAAQMLEKGIAEGKIKQDDAEAYELLSNGWIVAREYEKSLAPLAHAAGLSPKGELYVRLAQVRIQREEWDEATKALQKALDKGNLTSPGDAKLLMGIALSSMKRPDQARTWFLRAADHKETAEEAKAWLQQVETQLASAPQA